jgi:8-oxo-dGTP diphosphatase
LTDPAPRDDKRVAVAVVVQKGRYLLRQRPPGGHLAGTWEFPGGKVEPGESFEQACIREVQEEVACTGHVRTQLFEQAFDYPERRVLLRFFEVELEPGEVPRSTDAEAPLLWATPAQLLELPTPEANGPLIARLTRGLVPATRGRPSPLSVLAIATWGVPVSVALAALFTNAIERVVGWTTGRTLATIVQLPTPVSANATVFIALALVFEVGIIAWAAFVRPRPVLDSSQT